MLNKDAPVPINDSNDCTSSTVVVTTGRRKKSLKVFSVIIVGVLIVATIVVLPIVLTKKNSSTTKEETTMMTNKPETTTTTQNEQISFPQISINKTWKQDGVTIAGGNGPGNQLNQLSGPWNIFIDDDDQTIYIADSANHRIVEWKKNATNVRIVAGENGPGNRDDQLIGPTKVIVDKQNDSLIIFDSFNRRVVRWPRQNGQSGKVLISNIAGSDLMMDNDGYLYVSDMNKHEVRRWKLGGTERIIVAGGNGQGDRLDQLNFPYNIFIDEDHSVYVSDKNNHRVMKWLKGAKEGIVVAGGQGEGNSLRQLTDPLGIIVDQFGSVYVADQGNHRVMRWLKGAEEGSIVVGGNGQGIQSNQFNLPCALSFDRENNLYVVDPENHRVQKFNVN